MNFFQHEVPVQALLCCISAQRAFADRALDGIAFTIDDADRLAANLRNVAFFKEYEAARHGEEGGHVGGHEVLILT
jgi:hypothetical protein